MILSPDLFPVFVFQSNEYPCFTCGKVKNVFDDTLRDLTDIESSLKNITEFRQKTQLPEHDHLMLFTKYLHWKSLPVFYLCHRREFVYSIEKPVIVVIKDTCKFRIYLENVHFKCLVFCSLDLYYSPSKNNYQTDVTGNVSYCKPASNCN